jgi:hypothetical protein
MIRLLSLPLLILLLASVQRPPTLNRPTQEPSPIRRVNAPYNVPTNQSAIFWFGQVDNTNNHANVRVNYTDDELVVLVHIFDKRIWYKPLATVESLADWDAVSLYLKLSGNSGETPTTDAYHLVAQFNPPTRSRFRDNYQIAYRGDGTVWTVAPLDFTTEVGYRGPGYNNGGDAHGWWVKFAVPFTSLGLSGRPTTGAIWGLAVAVHDSDDAANTPIPDAIWPESSASAMPATWGQLRFGLLGFVPPPARPLGTAVIRHGVNGDTVVDGHVGGHSVCGSWVGSWLEWGNANYAGLHQINVQNQWDVADWPCFSKYYITIPLDDVPAGHVIMSAKLTMFQFGNAGQRQDPGPEPSFIQVLTVAEDWNESLLTWNNAPLAVENLTGTWVDPLQPPTEWPGVPREWDVSRAVAEAYAAGQPLRLALYSADMAQHSGRYFYSSDAGEDARPFLEVTWGEPFTPIRWSYVPVVQYQ